MLSDTFAGYRHDIRECLQQAEASDDGDSPALMAFIAYREWRIGREKLRLDLFDRRLEVLKLAELFAGKVLGQGYPTSDDFRTSWKAIGAAKLVFEDDVVDYLRDLHETAAQLRMHRSTIDHGSQTENSISKKKFDGLTQKFRKKSDHLADVFGKYLKYSHIQR